jgi:hypothetical protein
MSAHCRSFGLATEDAFGGEERGEEERRLDDGDALGLELAGDAAQHRVVAEMRQPREQG